MESSYQRGLPNAVNRVFMRWWHMVSSDQATGAVKADRAVLKRAGSLTAVACTPAYQRVYRDMAAANENKPWLAFQQERIAALVALAAHVKDSNSMSLPQAMSYDPEKLGRNPVSELRFRRLLDSPDTESLFNGIRRILPLIDHRVNPSRLADDIFSWGDAVKKTWAYSYAWSKKTAN